MSGGGLGLSTGFRPPLFSALFSLSPSPGLTGKNSDAFGSKGERGFSIFAEELPRVFSACFESSFLGLLPVAEDPSPSVPSESFLKSVKICIYTLENLHLGLERRRYRFVNDLAGRLHMNPWRVIKQGSTNGS